MHIYVLVQYIYIHINMCIPHIPHSTYSDPQMRSPSDPHLSIYIHYTEVNSYIEINVHTYMYVYIYLYVYIYTYAFILF
jgi:hypothetical protein